MEQFKQEWEEFKRKRFRRTKKWLRFLPSRSTLRKNIVFQKFGRFFFDKYPQLWSFDYEPMKAAYYAGWILTFMPVMGIQIVLAIILAIVFKANVMVLVALQMISNPFTVGFLWTLEYQLGKLVLSWLPISTLWLHQNTIEENIVHSSKSGAFLKATLSICIGGLILGLIFGKLSCLIHRYFLKHTPKNYDQFVKTESARRNRKTSRSTSASNTRNPIKK